MKKNVIKCSLLSTGFILLTGCASMQSGNKTEFINATPKGEISYIFPKGQCQDLYFDDGYSRISSTLNAQEVTLSKKETSQSNGHLLSSTNFDVPLLRKSTDSGCVVITKFPYQKYNAPSDTLSLLLFSAPDFSLDSVDYFLIHNARANYKFSITSKYKPDSVYNNFVRAVGVSRWDSRSGNSYTNINTYIGSGSLNVNSLNINISINVSPYRDGSITEIAFDTPGFITGSKVDFTTQINAAEDKLKAIASS